MILGFWLEKEMATAAVFLPGESHGQRSLAGYSPWGPRVGHDWNTWACMHAGFWLKMAGFPHKATLNRDEDFFLNERYNPTKTKRIEDNHNTILETSKLMCGHRTNQRNWSWRKPQNSSVCTQTIHEGSGDRRALEVEMKARLKLWCKKHTKELEVITQVRSGSDFEGESQGSRQTLENS